jgi:hypothetical protein
MRGSTSAVATSEVTTLQHELRDHSVEGGVLEPQVSSLCALLTSAKRTKGIGAQKTS